MTSNNTLQTRTSFSTDEEEARIEAERLKNLRGLIHDLLIEGVVMVRFIKANGELREMVCSLNAEHLPPQEMTEESEESTREPNLDILRVWDTEKQGWRSFRIDSVVGFSVV